MKKIQKEKDEWGQWVIYVQKCEKFDYEIQPDMPKLNLKHLEIYIKQENVRKQ